MSQRVIRCIVTLFSLVLVSATIALAQFPAAAEALVIPAKSTLQSAEFNGFDNWPDAQLVGSSKGKLVVVTLDQPQRRQACRIQSFTLDKLVCARAIGGHRTFLPQQVLALILPGDGNLKLRLLLGFNAGLGGAIWATVVLAAICPACAVGTGIAALLLLGAAGAVLAGDDPPDGLLYLAPGQQLTGKLRSLQP